MALSPEYKAFVEDILSGLGEISIRPMFGGSGVYYDGVMFGLIFYETLFLKADENSQADFEAEGAPRFSYSRKSRSRALPYWTVPERLYDDPEELVLWARKAHAVALRTKKKRSGKKSVG